MLQAGMDPGLSAAPSVVVVSADGSTPPSLSPFVPRLVTSDLAAVCPADDVVVLYGEKSAVDIGRLRRLLGRAMPPVLVAARQFDEQDMIAAFDQGATSYLLTDDIQARYCFTDATRRTAAGESFLSPGVATVLLRHLNRLNLTTSFRRDEVEPAPPAAEPAESLTARERQIMEMLVIGHTISEIAAHLGLVKKTVRNNLCNIYAKLQVGRQSEAILLWLGHERRQPRPEPALRQTVRQPVLSGRGATTAVG
jgi:DNA-binding NarL/FixJ family response regulator